jgi:AraC-like DNA-binding protein
MPIMDVTTSCGFKSPPHFSRCYRNQFGHPPSAERRVPKAMAPAPPALRQGLSQADMSLSRSGQ